MVEMVEVVNILSTTTSLFVLFSTCIRAVIPVLATT